MPYVRQEYRDSVEESAVPEFAGQLNYAITVRAIQFMDGRQDASEFSTWIMMLVENYLERVGRNYQSFNDVMGVLTCVPRELERRLNKKLTDSIRVERVKLELDAFSAIFYLLTVGPYEDSKIDSNGDVFPVGMVISTEEAA